MSKFSTAVFALIVVGLVLSFQNCGSKTAQVGSNPAAGTNLNSVKISGTVQKSTLDGCNYLICSIDNTTGQQKCFIPVKIDPSLLSDGNVVSIDGVIRDDMVSICMAGTIVEVQGATLVSGKTVTP